MIPFPEPNKTSPKSDANGHSQPGTPTIVQIPSEPNSDQQQADLDLNKPQEQDPKNLVKDEQQINQPKFPRHKSRGLSLKTKVTALAIALGTLPVVGIGAIAYYFADRAVVNQISPAKQARAVELANQLNHFMYDRYGDIQIMSSLPILENPKLRAAATLQKRKQR
jgi:hypothetical protein